MNTGGRQEQPASSSQGPVSSSSNSSSTTLGLHDSRPVAEQWLLEYAQALPELELLARSKQPPWPLRVLRSSQLDALRLDTELTTMLHEQFMQIFQNFQAGRIASLEPELNAMVSFLVFWLSVWRGRATPGSELMNLRYRNERAMSGAAASTSAAAHKKGAAAAAAPAPPWAGGGRTGVEGPGLTQQQRVLFGIGFVVLPYLWQKAAKLATQHDWGNSPDERGRVGWRLLRWTESAFKVASLANLWVFLYKGKYRSLLERALGARLVYRQPSMSRLISFEYLNRQLVWHELSEFLLFLLPLINVARLKRWVLGSFPRVPAMGGASSAIAGATGWPTAAVLEHKAGSSSSSSKHGQEGSAGAASAGRDAAAGVEGSTADEAAAAAVAAEAVGSTMQSVGPCPLCGVQEVLVPFVALPCQHVYCYMCLRANCEADADFACVLDGQRVTAMRRLVMRKPPS